MSPYQEYGQWCREFAAWLQPAGDQFALFESVAALAVLLRRFEFRLAPGAPPVGMTTVRC